MDYLLYSFYVLPCLLGELFLSIYDFLARSVPRWAVLSAVSIQLIWFYVFLGVTAVRTASVFILIACGTQFVLFLIARGGLGLGDVTALAVSVLFFVPTGLRSWVLLIIWWLLMSAVLLLQIMFLLLRKRKTSIACVPTQFFCALLTIALYFFAYN
ncbi:hypothetical protein HMPREF3214_01167 [Alloscardovia omnicolens]|uniref:hypothetical protein n=1 Tax=Alloscardovia omnicolens TaxID=419015 RepID=UPI000763BDCE|nr:hypothetical protein [Alloscardovia omnicolens]KWZ73710.1 hypothetical protein HMPREF3214_01167 [Alloscardovia omnicolens]MDU3532678.1 hypothetical protein [Alloscardovia omnicolens]